MGKKLYVGNIPYQAEEKELQDFFATIGEVESVKIIIDQQTGHSKGFGFVEMASEEDAKRAISDLNGTSFMGKTVLVNEARPQQPRERDRFGGGRGDKGRGGFGRDRGPGYQRGRR